jgi:hypothetical protein
MVDSLFSDAMQTNASHLWYALLPCVSVLLHIWYGIYPECSNSFLFVAHQDMSMPTPTQELIAKDLHGSEWRFKHIYRGMQNYLLFNRLAIHLDKKL